MPPKSVFRQPGTQHFQVVHRSQRDPLIHDPEASKHVLKPVQRGNLAKGKSRADLEQLIPPSHLAHDSSRGNIGEAAVYGIYFDDTDYDYMQHLKTVGMQEDGVDSIWVDAPSKSKGKGKAKDPIPLLELPEGTLASTSELPRNYESQENIPTSIAGFQPDMDPHLRQALEALEDDAFVDGELEDGFFGELVGDGEREADEEVYFEFHEEGLPDDMEDARAIKDSEDVDESWEARFTRFKQEQKSASLDEDTSDLDGYSDGGDTIGTLPQMSVIGGKKRRSKGVSDASGYSMSSSSMWRNEHLSVLDERFDQIQCEYDSSESEEEVISFDDLDEAPDLIASREDFESMMDEFLEKYEVIAGKMRPTLPGTPTEKLATIRKALGEARIRDAEETDSDAEDILMPLDVDEKDRWDCETILTTYSNLENHPRLIPARGGKAVPRIRLDPKTGLPSVVEGQPSKKQQPPPDYPATGEEEDSRPIRVTVSRPRNETANEKKARKQAVKQERQARRSDKKTTKERFSKEVKQQARTLAQREQATMRKL